MAGFTEIRGRYAISQLQQGPLNAPVPLLRQSNGTSCGEAVIAMTYNYAYPETPIREQQVIMYAVSNGYYTPAFYQSGKYGEDHQLLFEEYFHGEGDQSRKGLSLLVQKLQGGEPVIIDVLSSFHDPTSVAHFIVVTGISVDPSRRDAIVIQYNDPLTGTNRSADWDGSQGVWNAWQLNGDPGGAGWWLVIS